MPPDSAERVTAGAAQTNQDRAAVGPLAATLRQPGRLEPIDQAGDRARGKPEPAGKLAHAHVAV